MTQQNRTTLKTYFNTGDTPTESQFVDLIDSLLSVSEDPLTGAGSPSSTPDFTGQYYYDTAANRLYVADAASSPADWNLVGTSSTGNLTVTGTASETLAKGDVVSGTTGGLTKAANGADATSNVLGIANEAITAASTGELVIYGLITDVNTSSFGVGDVLYVDSTAGALVNVSPTTGNVAEVGTVMTVDASTGSIFVSPKLYGAATITQTDWVHAQALTPSSANGAEATTVDYATGGQTRSLLAFDATTSESAHIDVRMPNGWDEGTVTFTPYWSHPSTTTNFGVVWEFSAVAMSNDDTIDVVTGTAQTSADTGGTTDDLYIGPATAALTAGGTPAEGDMLSITVARLPANGSDTMAVDARLHGFVVTWTRNALDDA